MVLLFPITIWMAIKIIPEYERAVIMRLGRMKNRKVSVSKLVFRLFIYVLFKNRQKASGPGLFFVIPCTDDYIPVDLRTKSFDIPPQEILTKDSVTVAVDAVVYYRVFNAVDMVQNVENAHEATRLLAQTTLRNILGQ